MPSFYIDSLTKAQKNAFEPIIKKCGLSLEDAKAILFMQHYFDNLHRSDLDKYLDSKGVRQSVIGGSSHKYLDSLKDFCRQLMIASKGASYRTSETAQNIAQMETELVSYAAKQKTGEPDQETVFDPVAQLAKDLPDMAWIKHYVEGSGATLSKITLELANLKAEIARIARSYSISRKEYDLGMTVRQVPTSEIREMTKDHGRVNESQFFLKPLDTLFRNPPHDSYLEELHQGVARDEDTQSRG